MKKILQSFYKRPTLFSIIGLLIILIGTPYGIYGLTLKNGASLGGAIIIWIVMLTILILLVERLMFISLPLRQLNIFEFILLALGFVYYAYNSREMIIGTNPSSDYFVLIQNNGQFENTQFEYVFPFDKKMVTNDNYAVVDSIKKYRLLIELDEKNWPGHYMQPNTVDDVYVWFYCEYDREISESEIDSLVRIELLNASNAKD